jgi:hypothetical protein
MNHRTILSAALALVITACTTSEDAETDGGSASGSATGPSTSPMTTSTGSGPSGGPTSSATSTSPSTSGPTVTSSDTVTADTSTGPDSTSSTESADVVMRFFVTSVGNGPNGGDYGGLEGADARCQMLAEAAGSQLSQWRAYLSVTDGGEGSPVHARDRIGAGPWFNAAGALVAQDVQSLHDDQIDPALMLDENGDPAGKGPPPGPEHDMITGSNPDGTLDGGNRTCADWTSSAAGDRVQVGHHDFSVIPNPISPNQNWNSVHDSPCSAAGMANVLGSGRLYCFAVD